MPPRCAFASPQGALSSLLCQATPASSLLGLSDTAMLARAIWLSSIRLIRRASGRTDRLLSGMRPKSTVINLAGESLIEQLLWGSVLADFVSIYVAILNNVNPIPVQLIEKLKQELAES